MRRLSLIIIGFLFFSGLVYSQDPIIKVEKINIESRKDSLLRQNEPSKIDVVSIGIGFGIDFVGMGGNLTLYPQKNIGIFGSVGYAFAGVGYNVGVKLRIISDKSTSKISPFVSAMYGYNAAIVIVNATQYNRMFYGNTIGLSSFSLLNTGTTLTLKNDKNKTIFSVTYSDK